MTDPSYDAEALSDGALAFVHELEQLCIKHGVQLSTSGYDGIQVWALRPGEQPIHCAGIEDMTR